MSAMTPHPEDTIVALSSAAGPGRRAIVRVSGPKARVVVDAVFNANGPRDQDARRLVPGSLRLTGVHSPLPADLYFFPCPRSYTGQDLAELHTISSPPLVDRLIADLLTAGARPAGPGEFTLRAFLAGKLDLTRAEAVLAVIEAATDADLKPALALLAGGMARPLERLRGDLLDLLADVEAGLDFADEDITFVAGKDILLRVGSGLAQLTNLRRQLEDRSVSGRPVRVAIVGRPNAGKSSLFNALSDGPPALVGPTVGTTRDYLTKTITIGGVCVELTDTAGWSEAADTIAEQAQRLGREQAGRADVLLWCVPVGEEPGDAPSADAILVRTKADTRPETRDMRENRSLQSPVSSLVSCITPGGTRELRDLVAERVRSLARPPLAPSQSRCRHHVEAAIQALRRAHEHALSEDPPELLALALREGLDQIGEMVGAVFSDDLLDRIFSRFCVGK
jgi:tRNA modification GTPase